MKKLMLVVFLVFNCSMNSLVLTNDVRMQAIQDEYESSLKLKNDTFLSKISNKFNSLNAVVNVTKLKNPLLYELVESVSKKIDVLVPKNILIYKGNYFTKKMTEFSGADFRANAFAQGLIHRSSTVCIGEEVIKALTYEELYAVIAHELGHVKKYHMAKRLGLLLVSAGAVLANYAVLKKLIVMQGIDLSKPDLKKYLPLLGFNFVITNVISILSTLKVLELSRKQENEADEIAAKASGNKDDIINALKKLEKMLKESVENCFLVKIMRTHPKIEDREKHLAEEIENGLLLN